MKDLHEDARAGGRGAGIALAAALLCGCAAGARPLRLPEGHPADPATPGTRGVPGPPAPAPELPAPAPARTYACPMHPEVVSGEPGRCPKCGMRLQEVKPAEGEDAK